MNHYPEFNELEQLARKRFSGPVNPRNLTLVEQIVARRGTDWATAVLGEPYRGLRSLYRTSPWILIIADERDITPPLPPEVTAARAAHASRERELIEARTAAELRRAATWQNARAGLTTQFEIRTVASSRSKPNGTPHRHAVPLDDLSGPRRTHPGGRPMCQASARPRQTLDTPTNDPVTCIPCLNAVRALDR